MEKVLVSLPKEVVNMIDTELKGKLGDGRSDVIRTIVLVWLTEKGYLTKRVKQE